MEIYILRHGIAEDEKPGTPDPQRALTKEGKEKLESVLQRAGDAGVNPSVILTSPYLRALQTAEMAARILKHETEAVRTDSLVPGSSPEAVWNEIRDRRTEAQLLLAGHEPLLSHLVSYLLSAPSLQMEFKKGALVRIDVEGFRGEPHGVLKWILTPKLAK
ncbi:MAG: phosphohistidine phosphatase SixA [Acidobacteriota bacterium]|nr:phosphohistidine phosphatase SixA [Acidobacteriota bacterium]